MRRKSNGSEARHGRDHQHDEAKRGDGRIGRTVMSDKGGNKKKKGRMESNRDEEKGTPST